MNKTVQVHVKVKILILIMNNIKKNENVCTQFYKYVSLKEATATIIGEMLVSLEVESVGICLFH